VIDVVCALRIIVNKCYELSSNYSHTSRSQQLEITSNKYLQSNK